MQDHRQVKRHHMLKHAKILAAGSVAPIDCMVYDLTNTGAGLRISPEDSVPDCFELVIGSADSSRNCHVLWRNNERLGVIFSDAD
jgi:hypothetical protein